VCVEGGGEMGVGVGGVNEVRTWCCVHCAGDWSITWLVGSSTK
jgi:hypothetical protein